LRCIDERVVGRLSNAADPEAEEEGTSWREARDVYGGYDGEEEQITGPPRVNPLMPTTKRTASQF
jgi:hypothetical protein